MRRSCSRAARRYCGSDCLCQCALACAITCEHATFTLLPTGTAAARGGVGAGPCNTRIDGLLAAAQPRRSACLQILVDRQVLQFVVISLHRHLSGSHHGFTAVRSPAPLTWKLDKVPGDAQATRLTSELQSRRPLTNLCLNCMQAWLRRPHLRLLLRAARQLPAGPCVAARLCRPGCAAGPAARGRRGPP